MQQATLNLVIKNVVQKRNEIMKQCVDCAGAPVNHLATRMEVSLHALLAPVNCAFESVSRLTRRLCGVVFFDRLLPRIWEYLAKIKMGRFLDVPDHKNSYRTKVLWEEAKKRGIRMREFRVFNVPVEVFVAEYGNDMRRFDSVPRPRGEPSDALLWMDDKAIMRQKFLAAGIPVAKGGEAKSWNDALKFWEFLEKPIIVKPSQGSRSRHTTIHIETREQFEKAFKIAKQLSPRVIIEEELAGMVHRGTVINGKVVAIMRREPPYVIGNGVSTIHKLLAQENKKPERHGPIFHTIPCNEEVEKELTRQGYTWECVPAEGQMVILHQKVGRSMGGINRDMTDTAHPGIFSLLEHAAAFLKDPLVGFDFIVSDVTKTWSTQPRSGIIECNSLPFIDLHHYPFYGSPRNVAGAVWDMIFPESNSEVASSPDKSGSL